MRLLVCGAGRVGYSIASYLSRENHDVTVVDINENMVDHARNNLDINGVCGNISDPNVLNNAGIETADMIIAVTHQDESNMIACQIAHSLFNVPKKVARIRNQSLLDPAWSNLFSRHHLPIDAIISPEREVAQSIMQRLRTPGTTNDIPVASGKMHLFGVAINEDCPLLNTQMKQIPELFSDFKFTIVAVFRGQKCLFPEPNLQFEAGDEVYVITETSCVDRLVGIFGHSERPTESLIIIGGGHVGDHVAESMLQRNSKAKITIIESSIERAEYLSEKYDRRSLTVLHGNGLEQNIMDQAAVARTDTVLAVTNDEEANILGSLLAKQQGCQNVIALINRPAYAGLVFELGIDAGISPRAITVSKILEHVRRGKIKGVHSIRDGEIEVIEAQVTQACGIAGRTIEDCDLSFDTRVIAVMRHNHYLLPSEIETVQVDDLVIIATPQRNVPDIEKLLSVTTGLF